MPLFLRPLPRHILSRRFPLAKTSGKTAGSLYHPKPRKFHWPFCTGTPRLPIRIKSPRRSGFPGSGEASSFWGPPAITLRSQLPEQSSPAERPGSFGEKTNSLFFCQLSEILWIKTSFAITARSGKRFCPERLFFHLEIDSNLVHPFGRQVQNRDAGLCGNFIQEIANGLP